MSDDALARLKNRNRPVVENRDTSISVSQDISISGNQEKQVSTNQDIQNNEDLKTKQTTVRLEVGLSRRLQALCHEEDISREVLIEAMFEFLENNSKARSKILAAAKSKNDYRQQIANKRRAKSMIDKFG